MSDAQESEQVARRLAKTYGLRVPDDVIASALTGRPKLPVLLSRASFRADVDVRTNQRAQIRRDRRNFLRAGLALVALSASTWVLWSIGANSQPVPSTQTINPINQPTVPTNPIAQTPQPASSNQPIANAANLPPDQALVYNDPSLGPIILIHLDNGQFVAYSAICTHAGCQVQFDPSLKDIVCPCHGAVYDPYHNAQVIAGPAPYALQSVPIKYNPSTGNIYLNG
jgi:Rieske Fe-S protein